MTNLNRWARDFGYSDFDTFLRTGGSIADAFRDIQRRIRELQDALTELGPSLQWVRQPSYAGHARSDGPEVVSKTSAEEDDFEMNTPDRPAESDVEPVDSANAHIQGDDHVG